MSVLKTSVARTAIWLAAARIAQTVVSLAVPLVLVRALTKPEYGFFKQVDLVAALLFPLLALGLGTSLTYFVPRLPGGRLREISTAMLAILGLSLVVLVAGSLFPGQFSRIFQSGEMRLLVVAIIAAAMANVISQVGVRALLAVGAARAAALAPMVVVIPRAVTIAAVAWVTSSLRQVLVVLLLFAALEVIVVLGTLARAGCFGMAFDRRVLLRQLGFGAPLGAVALVRAWGLRIDRYVVSAAFGPAMFAVYSVGNTRIPLVRVLPAALDSATAPRFSALEAEGRYEEMAGLWRQRVETMLPISLLLACCLAATSQWSIPFAFTAEYSDAVPVFRVFAFSLLIQATGGMDLVLRALAALRFLSVTIVLALIVRIVLCLALLPLESLTLLAAGQLAVTLVERLVHLSYLRQRLSVDWRTILPSRGLALALGLALVGIAATALAGSLVDNRQLPALLASATVWMVLGAVVLWRQGLWSKLRR